MGVAAVAILLVLLAVALLPSAASAATINVPADQPSINTAIAAAAAGDTILVAPGTYTENVLVNKSVTLAGGGVGTVISAVNPMDSALEVTANNALVSGFTVTDSYVNEIAVTNANGVTISNVNVTDGGYSIGYGIWVDRGASTIVGGSTVNISGGPGIVMYATNLATVINNTVSGAAEAGIWIWESTNTEVSGNTVSGAGVASITGLLVQESGGTTVTGNTLSGCSTGLDLRNVTNAGVHHNTISLNSNVGVWALGAAGEATINDNTIAGNNYGVFNEDELLLDCTSNWWGDASGPLDAKSLPGNPNYNNPTGLGNAVSSYVEYDPWATNGLTLTVTVVGNGAVTKNPDALAYELGETVQLTPVPAAGWVFAGWSGAATGTANPLNLIMTGDLAVTATFTQAPLVFDTITVTAPAVATSQAQGSALPVTWTTNANVTGGQFSTWIVSATNSWYAGNLVAADGSASYADSVALNVPVGTGYRIFVYYRATPTDPWGIYGFAAGTVDVTAAGFSSITVTAPAVATSQAQGSALPVTWTTNANVTGGQFSTWIVSAANSWYAGNIVAADGSASYADSVALNVPVGTGYRVFVYYRATPTDPWGIYGFAAGTVDVTAATAFNSITVTAPAVATSQAQGSALPVTWTTNANVTGGQFSTWIVSAANSWYAGNIVAADGTASYADSVALNVPVGTGYRVFVYYRATPTDPWGIYGFAAGTVDVTAAGFSSITVTAPAVATSQAQGSALPVTWTTNANVTGGQFSTWIVSAANSWYAGNLVAADGTASYADSVALNVPVGTGYRIFVYYRATPTDPWGIYGFAAGTVDVL